MNLFVDFVKRVKQKPLLYLGEYSLTSLYNQLLGISWAIYTLNSQDNNCNPFRGFNKYIGEIYNDSSTRDYRSIILANSKNEKDALNNFFKHFDAYIRIPAYKKNALYLRFSKYMDSEKRDFQNFVFNLSYLRPYSSGFDNGCTEEEIYSQFLQYLEKEKGIADAKNWHRHFSEKYQNEDSAFEEGFRLLTEFLKITVGEACFPDGLD